MQYLVFSFFHWLKIVFEHILCNRNIPVRCNFNIFRFAPPKDVFAYVENKPDNDCFCVGGPPCLGGGLFNISACKFGKNLYVTFF